MPEASLWSRIVPAAAEPAQWTESRGTGLVDLYDVSVARGRIVLHGVDRAAALTLLPGYRHFVRNRVRRDQLDDVFVCSPEPLRRSECVRVEDDAVFILSPWHIDNAYHLHNDNLVAMFANLRHAGVRERPRRLCLFEGDPARNAQALQLWQLMAAMFDGHVASLSSLVNTPERVALRHVRWGGGPLMFYLRDPDATPFAGAALEFQRWALEHFGVPSRTRTVAREETPRVLMVQRTGQRRLAADAPVADALRAAGCAVRLLGDWAGVNGREIVSMAHDADILVGVHGAALAHMAYLPPKSLVAELRVDGLHPHVYAHMAPHFGHRHEPIDMRGVMTRDGLVITADEAARVASRIMDAWRDRHRRRALTVRTLGTGNWGNEVFWYMFGKTYSGRHGLEFQVDAWAGNTLIAANDPPLTRVLPDVHEKVVHGVHDTRIPHGPPLADVNVTGYFQYHTSYYAPDRGRIREWFRPAPAKEAVLGPAWQRLRTRGRTAVGIHIRRRDYGFSYFSRTPTRWYLEQLDRLWPTLDAPFLYVASDALEEVLPHFARFTPATAADLGPPFETHDFYRDFYALQHCEVLLIPNSTFSFSASMLNDRLQRAYRSHIPSRGFVPFDPWDSKPLDQTWDACVERYPWIAELWGPTTAWDRWTRSAEASARHYGGLALRVARKARVWFAQRPWR